MGVCALPGFAQEATRPVEPSGNVSSGTTATGTKADHSTVSFIKQAAKDNSMEVALAQVGLRQAQNQDLKSFCEMLQKDHSQANRDLQPIAQRYGVNVDEPLTKHEQHEVNKFEKETGNTFDQKFVTEMLRSHEKDIAKFQKASQNLTETDVRDYAQTMLPKLREHMQRAATVARSVGVDPSTISSYMKDVQTSVGGTSDTYDATKGQGGSDQLQKNSNVPQK